jgi:hypothetical protein
MSVFMSKKENSKINERPKDRINDYLAPSGIRIKKGDVSKINERPKNRINDYLAPSGICIKRACIILLIQALSFNNISSLFIYFVQRRDIPVETVFIKHRI